MMREGESTTNGPDRGPASGFIRSNVVGFLALFVALGGGAYATHTHRVDTNDLRKGAVTAPKLAKQAVGTAKLQARAVKQGKIAPNAIRPRHILNGAVRTPKIEDGAVTEEKLAEGVAISGPQGPPGPQGEQGPTGPQGEQGPPGPATGTAGGDLTGNYPDPLIAAGAVSTGKLADLAVTMPKLAEAAVTTEKLADSAVTTAKLANDSVSSAKIIDGSVGLADLADDSVNSAKIIDGSVGLADLANDSVNSARVVDESLTGDDIAPDAIGSDELAPNAIDSSALIAPNAIRYSDYAKLVVTNLPVNIPNIAPDTCIVHNFLTNNAVNALDVVQALPPANPEHLGLVYYPARTITNNQAEGYVCNVTNAAINPPNTGFDLVVYNRPG